MRAIIGEVDSEIIVFQSRESTGIGDEILLKVYFGKRLCTCESVRRDALDRGADHDAPEIAAAEGAALDRRDVIADPDTTERQIVAIVLVIAISNDIDHVVELESIVHHRLLDEGSLGDANGIKGEVGGVQFVQLGAPLIRDNILATLGKDVIVLSRIEFLRRHTDLSVAVILANVEFFFPSSRFVILLIVDELLIILALDEGIGGHGSLEEAVVEVGLREGAFADRDHGFIIDIERDIDLVMGMIYAVQSGDLDAEIGLLVGEARRDIVIELQAGVDRCFLHIIAARGRIDHGVNIVLVAKDLAVHDDVGEEADLLQSTRLAERRIRDFRNGFGHVVALGASGVEIDIEERPILI